VSFGPGAAFARAAYDNPAAALKKYLLVFLVSMCSGLFQ
jgi:hypothetical protein